jgi:hypothetical protein
MKASFDYTPWESPITLVAGVLVAGTDETDLIPTGTGVLCAPFVGLTARHVIDEIFQRFEQRTPGEAGGELSFGLHFANRLGTTLVKWDVMGYGYSSSIDIASLVLEPAGELPPGFAWHLPRFEALPPKVGERVTAFGFPRSTHRLTAEGAARIGLDPHTASGDVIELHYERRDSAVLPFPCLHTNARFDPGMSGGSVFNSAGQVCGLISSNMPPDTPEGEHSSYVSLIWPALGLGLNVEPAPPRVPMSRYYLKRLAEKGQIRMLHAECVTVTDGQREDWLRFRPPGVQIDAQPR